MASISEDDNFNMSGGHWAASLESRWNASEAAREMSNASVSPAEEFYEQGQSIIIIYSIVFVISVVGNAGVLIFTLTGQRTQTRINYLIMHLAIADMLVAFFNMPLEIGWRITVQWHGGNMVCKFFQYCRVFSLFLSSFVIIVVSLDRYCAVIYPIRRFAARSWSNKMLVCAWIAAGCCSIPQAYIFHIRRHPVFASFEQCGSFDLPGLAVYTVYTVIVMYCIPLLVIVFAYTKIFVRITSRRRLDANVEAHFKRNQAMPEGQLMLRCSGGTLLQRAKIRALRMTIVIVGFFVIFWTPYSIMSIWWVFDKHSADQFVDSSLQHILYMFAMLNSCVNPLIYGSFALDMRKLPRACHCLEQQNASATEMTPQSRSAFSMNPEVEQNATTSRASTRRSFLESIMEVNGQPRKSFFVVRVSRGS